MKPSTITVFQPALRELLITNTTAIYIYIYIYISYYYKLIKYNLKSHFKSAAAKSARRRGVVVSGISRARGIARDIGSVGNGNALFLLVFNIAEVIGNSSIELLNIYFG